MIKDKCIHKWVLIKHEFCSAGMDDKGTYQGVEAYFFCEKCLKMKAKRNELYYNEGD